MMERTSALSTASSMYSPIPPCRRVPHFTITRDYRNLGLRPYADIACCKEELDRVGAKQP
jgi:hypothetical protein